MTDARIPAAPRPERASGAATRPGCGCRCRLEEGAEAYEAFLRFDERHQGGPGIVHGGIVAAALDEAAGLLATWYRFPTVTARIFVRYRRPVPIDTELLARAWVESARGRRIHVEARLVDGDEVLAEAKAAFLHVPLEHFLATPQGREAGRRWRERLGSGRRGSSMPS